MNYVQNAPRGLQREQESKFGTQITSSGVRFRLWAPLAEAVDLKIYDLELSIPMVATARGWYEIEVPGARSGMRYRFRLGDGTEVADPASRFQPDDVDGPSEIIDPRDYCWQDVGWRGRPWEETIIYELHIGTFTPEGTFRAAIDKLDALVELGITALEIMPVADFPGRRNWGYDGVYLFAPDASYGRPDDLKALVDAAHARGLSVFLDVVYNHFGPKGNNLGAYVPLLNDEYETPWGAAVNFDTEGSEGVRDLIYSNARHWLNEYRFDGLRFDAVHEINDDSARHVLLELAEQIRASTDGRFIHLIAENEHNQASWLKRRENGAPWLYDAQWSDDIHHGLHSAVTGESFQYYADYDGRIDLVGRALAEGMAWQGEYLERELREKGEPSAFLPPTAFVAYAQNHDQIGNRPFGERLCHLVGSDRARMCAAIYLLSPHIPQIFMGEEWAAKEPFLFFSDVGDDLAEGIQEGRKAEMDAFPRRAGQVTPPDPMAKASFDASKLNWSDREQAGHAEMLALYRQLIAVRKQHITPRLAGTAGFSGRYEMLGPHGLRVTWTLANQAVLTLIANFSDEALDGLTMTGEDQIWLEGLSRDGSLGAWSAVFELKTDERSTGSAPASS